MATFAGDKGVMQPLRRMRGPTNQLSWNGVEEKKKKKKAKKRKKERKIKVFEGSTSDTEMRRHTIWHATPSMRTEH